MSRRIVVILRVRMCSIDPLTARCAVGGGAAAEMVGLGLRVQQGFKSTLYEVMYNIFSIATNHAQLVVRLSRICSIDPLTARDLDDALSVEPLLGGRGWRVGVHIADVAHFVAAGTALDAEAAERGTSVYMVDRVIPMLPPLLCEQLCSLNPGVCSYHSPLTHKLV